MQERINKLKEIANKNGVNASIRELNGSIFANINGQSFKVRGCASFNAKCRELKDYQAPEPIELTDRLAKIEEAAIAQY